MRRLSIAFRLAAGVAGGMALLWLGAAAVSVAAMQLKLYEVYDESLRQNAFGLLPLAVHEFSEGDEPGARLIIERHGDRGGGDNEQSDDVLVEHDPSFTYVIRDPPGEVVLRDQGAPETVDAELPEGFSDVAGQRTFVLTDEDSGYSIVVLETSDRRITALRDSIAALVLPLLALIPLIVGGVWIAARLALQPLERLRREIAQRHGRNLAPLSAQRHPVELAPIAEAVAALLNRLKSALDAERAFAARSAHELRTPVAGALAQTQQLATELAGAPGSARVQQIEASLHRLSRLADKLLQIARVEAGFAMTGESSDQLSALSMVVRDFNASSAFRDRVVLAAPPGAHLHARIDPDAFAIVMRNLIENGLKHGAADRTVRVAVTSDAVHVVNDGVPVAPDDLERLGQPFIRGTTHAEGSGLGLSIARSIMEQAGGRLELRSPATGADGGFEAIVRLPTTDPRSVITEGERRESEG
jgi:two-component system OmpR family sensor kinase